MSQKYNNVLNYVKDYWFILLFCISSISFAFNIRTQLNNADARSQDNKTKIETLELMIIEIRLELAKINTNLEYIKKQTDK